MTDSPQPESGDITPLDIEDNTPLRGLIFEVHEIYDELLYVGFEDRAATQIVAHMLLDAMQYRGGFDPETSEDEDEDDSDSEWTGESEP